MGSMLSSLGSQFALLDERSRGLLGRVDHNLLFARPNGANDGLSAFSCGESLLRSAATVERTFGGITTRLWDDPFEWTLPEKLSDKTAILAYLDEVEATRLKGFAYFSADVDLTKTIPAPQEMSPLIDILLDTLARASHYQGRAFAVYQMISGDKGSRL